jgi:hypothetical protein
MAREFDPVMLEKLLAHIVPSDARYDRLFTAFAPNGAPRQVLEQLYYQHADALADELAPPQHQNYRALIGTIVEDAGGFDRLDGPALKRVYAAYASCFERAETHHFQRMLYRGDRPFREALERARENVIAELLLHESSEQERRSYYARWKECEAAALDISGVTLGGLIIQMQPDDWHEIVQHWDWDWGVEELNWITSQRECDRATAVYVLCKGRPSLVAMRHNAPHGGFVRDLAARLEGGFYPNAELSLGLALRTQQAFEEELDIARLTGVSPWQLPDLLTHPGRRSAEPKYTLRDGQVRYDYAYWLRHLAPRRR